MSTGEEFGFASIDHSSDEPLRGHARVDAEGLHWAGDDPSTPPKSVAWRDLLAFHASPPELEDRVMLRLTVARQDPTVLEVLGGGGRKARELLVATKRMLATRLELQHAERQMARAAALRERVTDWDHTLRSGARYKGERDSLGQRHGRGIMAWPSGCWYVGEWSRNQRHGDGVLKGPRGMLSGYFEGGSQYVAGVFKAHDGGLVIGKWQGNKRHGRYLRCSPAGVVSDEVWYSDVRVSRQECIVFAGGFPLYERPEPAEDEETPEDGGG